MEGCSVEECLVEGCLVEECLSVEKMLLDCPNHEADYVKSVDRSFIQIADGLRTIHGRA